MTLKNLRKGVFLAPRIRYLNNIFKTLMLVLVFYLLCKITAINSHTFLMVPVILFGRLMSQILFFLVFVLV